LLLLSSTTSAFFVTGKSNVLNPLEGYVQ
jgi:hypothetical protein